jgi:hypothetical protein
VRREPARKDLHQPVICLVLTIMRSQLDGRSLEITMTFSRSVHSVSIGAWPAST